MFGQRDFEEDILQHRLPYLFLGSGTSTLPRHVLRQHSFIITIIIIIRALTGVFLLRHAIISPSEIDKHTTDWKWSWGAGLGYIIFNGGFFPLFFYFQRINRDDNIMQAWRGGWRFGVLKSY